jgi:hypothetical protein
MPNTRHAADNLDSTTPEYTAFARYVSLVSRKRLLKDELEDIEASLQSMEPQLLAYLGEGPGGGEEGSGFDMVRLGGYTISPYREPWVKVKPGYTRNDACEALKANDLGHYVYQQFNTKSLTAHIQQLEKDRGVLADQKGALALLLPAGVIEVIEIKPSFRIRALRR